MKYNRSEKYQRLHEMIMGPNPLKLAEELLENRGFREEDIVCDLGSGTGLTSLFIHKEYGPKVIAADLWSDPKENEEFFKREGVEDGGVTAVKADATSLPFGDNAFDAITCIDSWNYFGRDKAFLDEKISRFIKKGGKIYLAITAMEKEFNGNYPECLLFSWNEEQLEYIKDLEYWRDILSSSKDFNLLECRKMETDDEAWNDWLKEENEYAVGDRKSMESGAGDYLCFIMAVLEKK
ncbi:MAG: class I SAM-dependent methyltransferase [Candidatus Ornithospirochaeta sp.]